MCTVPSPLSHRPFGGISANQLRCLAMFLMLLDHLWATLVPGNFWMTYAGRLAFPIFAFQISEGFFHTSDRKRYAMRLLAFALLSEIPFDLLYGSTVFYPFHQNVLFTLLLGLLAISAIDRARRERSAKTALRAALVLPGTLLLSIVGFQGLLISLLGWEFPTQGFAVLALLPIWLYNGRPGRKSRALQYGSYAFYPVHMLILYLLFSLLR